MVSLFFTLSVFNFEKHMYIFNYFFFLKSFPKLSMLSFILRFKKFFVVLNSMSSRAINKDFYHLILKKWVFLVNNVTTYFFLYNYFVFKILYQTCSLVFFLMKKKKRVLFVTDSTLENAVSFRDLNYISLPSDMRHFSYLYGDHEFWIRESRLRVKSNFLLKNLRRRRFDLLVVLCVDYKSLRPSDFLGVTKISLGFADLQTRHNLFNYFVPVIQNKFFSAQIFKEFMYFFFNK